MSAGTRDRRHVASGRRSISAGESKLFAPEATLIMFSPWASTVISAIPVASAGIVFTRLNDNLGSRASVSQAWRP